MVRKRGGGLGTRANNVEGDADESTCIYRLYFEEMLSHAYVSLALCAVHRKPCDRLDPMRLAQIANHTRAAFFREYNSAPHLSDEQLFGDAGSIL